MISDPYNANPSPRVNQSISNQKAPVIDGKRRAKTIERIDNKKESGHQKMSQIQESEQEWEESATEEAQRFNHMPRRPMILQIKKRPNQSNITVQSGIGGSTFRLSQKESSRIMSKNNTIRESAKSPGYQEQLDDGACEIIEEENHQTFVATEEEPLNYPDNIKKSSINERRKIEKDFFENVKKESNSTSGEVLYIVDIKWVKEWTVFLSGAGKPPGKIANNSLYKKYFSRKQKLQVSQDFYFMTERMWKFLYSIYGGGPIMKKYNNINQSNGSSQDLYQMASRQHSSSIDGVNNPYEPYKEQNSFDLQSPLIVQSVPFGQRGEVGKFKEIEQSLSLVSSPEMNFLMTRTVQRNQTPHQDNSSLTYEEDNTRPASAATNFLWYHQAFSDQKLTSGKRKPEYPTVLIKNFNQPNQIIKESRVIGLDNPNFYCYMNAVVQVLLGLIDFRLYFVNKEFMNIAYATHFQRKIMCQGVSKLFKEILTLEEEYEHLKPTFFHKLIDHRFQSSMQHDAHEFLMYMLSQLQDELNPGPQNEVNRRFSMTSSMSSTFWKSYQLAHPSVIDQLFVGQLSQIVQCKQCENKSISSIPFKDISLSITPSLKQSLSQYMATERLDKDEKYNCLECQTLTNAKIKKKFLNMPKYLIIHLKRFEEANDQTFKKNKQPIDYPLTMEMDDYCNQPWEKLGRYSLIGLILHKGKNLESGHYYAISKRLDGNWWFCNDAEIKLVQGPEHVLQTKKAVYLLIYQRDLDF